MIIIIVIMTINVIDDNITSSIISVVIIIIIDIILIKIRACVRYFLPIFYFFTKWQPFKNWKVFFISSIKSSFRSRDIQIFVIFSRAFYTFQIQKGKWK